MSKILNRIGKKSVKTQFELQLDKVELNLNFPCEVSILWKRGSHKIETKNPSKLNITTGIASIKETLILNSKLYYSKDTDEFLAKKSTITVIISNSKGKKIAGNLILYIDKYANSKETDEVISLTDSPDPNAKIHFRMKTLRLDSNHQSNDLMNSSCDEKSSSNTSKNEITSFSVLEKHQSNVDEIKEHEHDRSPKKLSSTLSVNTVNIKVERNPRKIFNTAISEQSTDKIKNWERDKSPFSSNNKSSFANNQNLSSVSIEEDPRNNKHQSKPSFSTFQRMVNQGNEEEKIDENKEILERVRKLETKLKKKEQDYESLLEEYQRNESVYGNLLNERDNFSSSNKYAVDELKKVKDKMNRYMKENQRLEEKVEELELEFKIIKKENDKLIKEKTELKKELHNNLDIVLS